MPSHLNIIITSTLILLGIAPITRAQSDIKDSLKSAFSRYESQVIPEKIFAHVDRSFYLAGETIWFKLYDIDGLTNKPQPLSGIAYIELLGSDQRPILQAKIEMKEGEGDGSLSIPLSIPSGHYLFRAYTSWMRNFDAEFYFTRELTIINTLNDPSDSIHPPATTDASNAAIQFFPEGGNLVNGLSSVIAVRTIDRQGRAASCDGFIIDQSNDTVGIFHSNKFGIGKISFTPTKDNTCYAVARFGGAIVKQPLPNAFDQGYVMHLDQTEAHRLHVTIHAAGPLSIPTVYLFVQSHGKVKNVQMNFLVNNETSFYLDKDSLDEGISHLTLFNGSRTPVCERLYFKQPGQRLNINVTIPLLTFPTRSPVSVSLSTTDMTSQPIAADLSMAVFLIDSLQSIPSENILSYLLLNSDLKGNIESPADYFSLPAPAAAEALDDLMLTQGWSRFRWEDILKNQQPYFEFLPETNGAVMIAKVIDKRTGQPPAPVIGYLSLPGKHFKLATSRSQADGSMYFHLDNFFGSRALIIQTNSKTDSNCRIDITSPFSDRFAPILPSNLTWSNNWPDQLLRRSIGAQAENAYLAALKHRYDPAAEDTLAFYGKADLKYNLDDYTRFVTMEEVIQEFVENVHLRRTSGHAYFRARNALFNLFFDDDPLLLIDGIPVFNADKLVATDPAKIEKIEVVSHKYILGPSLTDGIVSFRSYDGEFAGFELDPNAVAVQYNGLDQHREFYTPVYGAGRTGQPSIPDFRNELLWAPNILVDATGKQMLPLYTSDLTGKFALVVQGITADGLAGYSVVTFSVSQ